MDANAILMLLHARFLRLHRIKPADDSRNGGAAEDAISKGPSPKAKISADISKDPAHEKGPNQSKCLLTIQLLLASTKPANACGARAFWHPRPDSNWRPTA